MAEPAEPRHHFLEVHCNIERLAQRNQILLLMRLELERVQGIALVAPAPRLTPHPSQQETWRSSRRRRDGDAEPYGWRANLIAARQPVDNSQPLDTRKLPRVVGCKRYAKPQGLRPDHHVQ